MCSDVGCNTTKRPSYEEIMMMGCTMDQCAGCDVYVWEQMLGKWQPLDGICRLRMLQPPVRADSQKCQYFVSRKDL